jgi:hypothetical protein
VRLCTRIRHFNSGVLRDPISEVPAWPVFPEGRVAPLRAPGEAAERPGRLDYLKVETERAGDVARLAIVHVSSHSRQRHKVLTVIVLAIVSTRLPWQNGHVVGRVTSLNSDPDIVAMFPSGGKRDKSIMWCPIEAERLPARAQHRPPQQWQSRSRAF